MQPHQDGRGRAFYRRFCRSALLKEQTDGEKSFFKRYKHKIKRKSILKTKIFF